MTATLISLAAQAVQVASDQIPEEEDVVAGWTAFAVFGLLGLAVVVLGFSLTKRLRNAERSAEAGRYDPSDPTRSPQRPARGLAAARAIREERSAGDPPADGAPRG